MSLLFTSIDSLQEVVLIPSDFPFSTLEPQLRACQQFVARFVGEALIERLTIKLEAEEELSAEEKKLLQLLRVPVANLALYRYANLRNVKLDDTGVHRTQSTNSADAFEWQLVRMLSQLEADAWEGLEELHRFLEANRNQFEEYSDSDAFKADQKSLIRSAALFSQFYFINDSRLTFYALQPAMRQAQRKRLAPALGAQLTILLAGDNLTESQELMLEHARVALVHATLARAIRERIIEVGAAGVQVLAVRSFSQNNYKQQADAKNIDKAIAYHEEECVDALNDLAKLVNPPSQNLPTTGGLRGGNGIVSF